MAGLLSLFKIIVPRLFASLSEIIPCCFGKGCGCLGAPTPRALSGAQSACSTPLSSCKALDIAREGPRIPLLLWGHHCDIEEWRGAFTQSGDPQPAQCGVHSKCKVISSCIQ